MLDLTKNVKTKQTPPYISAAILIKLFKLFSTRSLKEISREYLDAQGIHGSDGFSAVTSLKFLGIVDENYQSTDIAKKFHLEGEPKKEAMKEMIKTAYRELFEIAPNAGMLNSTELQNEFIGVYGLTKRLAIPAVKAFTWLCNEAGIRVEDINDENEAQINERLGVINSSSNIVANSSTFDSVAHLSQQRACQAINYQTFLLAGGIEIRIPANERVSLAILSGELKEVVDIIKEFAEKMGLLKDIESAPLENNKELAE
jgi:hypothetical protein